MGANKNRGRKNQIKGSVRVGDFSAAFGKEMVKYTSFVESKLEYITEQLAVEAAKEINSVAKSTFRETQAKYITGWTAMNKHVRHRARWIIHNKNQPGLAHLLEHGHASGKGTKRTPGRIHIAPIEEKLAKDYEENVAAIIERGY